MGVNIPDLYEETYMLTKQIPRGKVSTYGAIARALGDVIAARAVGKMLHENPYKEVPCYRVIHSDGRVGGYAGGVEKKIEMLKRDGIEIINGKIDLNKYLFDDFVTDMPLKRLREEQVRVASMVKQDGELEWKIIGGMDVSYGNYAHGAYVEMDSNGRIIRGYTVSMKIRFPYIPTYLAFRELPVLERLYEKAEADIIMVNGNGILHPLMAGLASHFGVVMDVPTIGVAKKLLLGEILNDSIIFNGKVVGKKVGRVYISPGHKIGVESAAKIAKNFMKYSIPEPVRQAHILANEERRKREG